MRINKEIISQNKSLYIIAEIGINHNGSIKNAFKMIDYAKDAGCDAVKFQTYSIDKLLKKETKLIRYQKSCNFNNMYELLKKNNLTYEEFHKLKNYCKKKKINFLSTPFDLESADFLFKLNIDAFKVSSGDFDNFILLDQLKKYHKPIILSCGMSQNDEIIKTLNVFCKYRNKIALLHCISDYPTKLKDTQLNQINFLKKFKIPIGFSDHTVGNIASTIAVAFNACIIEKHITLDTKLDGPDHKCSLACKDLKEFVSNLKIIKKSLINKKRYLTHEEKKTKKIARKTLYFSKNLKKNHKILLDDIIALRPRNNGLSPSNYKFLLNKKITRSTKRFQIISRKDFA